MPLTVVVVDDDLDYRHIVRYLLASVSDTMVIVGEAASQSRSANAPTS